MTPCCMSGDAADLIGTLLMANYISIYHITSAVHLAYCTPRVSHMCRCAPLCVGGAVLICACVRSVVRAEIPRGTSDVVTPAGCVQHRSTRVTRWTHSEFCLACDAVVVGHVRQLVSSV